MNKNENINTIPISKETTLINVEMLPDETARQGGLQIDNSESLTFGDASWIAGEPPPLAAFSAKTRYRQQDAACTLQAGSAPDTFCLRFAQPQWAVTPGQSAVLYDGPVCLGGGIIL